MNVMIYWTLHPRRETHLSLRRPPPRSSHSLDSTPETRDAPKPPAPPSETPKAPKIAETPPRSPVEPRRPKWERRLPKRYTVAATPGVNSLHLPLEIESTESALKFSVDGLVDCGATSEFIDSEYA